MIYYDWGQVLGGTVYSISLRLHFRNIKFTTRHAPGAETKRKPYHTIARHRLYLAEESSAISGSPIARSMPLRKLQRPSVYKKSSDSPRCSSFEYSIEPSGFMPSLLKPVRDRTKSSIAVTDWYEARRFSPRKEWTTPYPAIY